MSEIGELLWAEKYRPRTLDEIINQEEVVTRLKRFVEAKNLPHLLFAGPPGTGKCVTPSTPILTTRGVVRAEELLSKYFSKAKEEEEYVELGKDAPTVYTLTSNGSIRTIKPSHAYKGWTQRVVRLKTLTGRTVKLTPSHPLLSICEDGPCWVKAEDIRIGDKIATPRFIPLSSQERHKVQRYILDYVKRNHELSNSGLRVIVKNENDKIRLAYAFSFLGIVPHIYDDELILDSVESISQLEGRLIHTSGETNYGETWVDFIPVTTSLRTLIEISGEDEFYQALNKDYISRKLASKILSTTLPIVLSGLKSGYKEVFVTDNASYTKLLLKSASHDVEYLLASLKILLSKHIYWDTVVDKHVVKEESIVYDLTVPGTANFVGGEAPIILHNTTAALCLAHDLYGENYRRYLLELNASDERGIETIRTKVKEFARSVVPGDIPFKLVLLDEADNMTADAQQALRRLMEMYTANTRFILIANFPSKIIEPIQSRTAYFRFTPLKKEDVVARLKWICEKENVSCQEDALEAIYDISEGDMRRAINILQSASALGEVTVDTVYKVVGLAHPREVREMILTAIRGDFLKARDLLRTLMINYGLSGVDVVKQVHRELFGPELKLPEEYRVLIADKLGEIQYRLVEGGDDEIQLNAFLAWLTLLGERLRGS